MSDVPPASSIDVPLSYLDVYLGPVAEQLARPEITDLYVNGPGVIWAETLGGGIERIVAPALTDGLLWGLARQVARLTHQGISRQHPLLAATLPDGSRVQVIAPPATRGPMAIAIRKHVVSDFSLDDYDRSGMFSTIRGADTLDPVMDKLRTSYRDKDWVSFLRFAATTRKTMLISGGTSTGKTTFLNALLREIDRNERLILIEDTPELSLSHPNAIGLIARRGELGEANVSQEDLLIASLRMRPDRIVLGEMRGTEAFTFLRAINTGHPGSMSTIHADTPALAVQQIALLVLQAGLGLKRDDITDYVKTTVDVIVQLSRRGGLRAVDEIWWRDA